MSNAERAMKPQERRTKALREQVRIDAKHCATCTKRVNGEPTHVCRVCPYGMQLQAIGGIMDETMRDMRFERVGVIV